MKLVSIQVGLPREVVVQGQRIRTAIFKESAGDGPVMVRRLNLDGDAQADLSVHGGTNKAAYAYPSEHYPYWRDELPGITLPNGIFGENFTTEGLLESEVHIGDRYRIGEAEVVVTQPRLPCFKLGIRFGRADILHRFRASRRSGFYLAVVREGWARAGDAIERLSRDGNHVSVADLVRLHGFEPDDLETMRRALRVEALPEGWRARFCERLEAERG